MSTRRFGVWFGFVLFGLLTLPIAPAAAQTNARLSGTIVDDQNLVLPGVSVNIINERTRYTRTAATDDKGEFHFDGVEPGMYTVRFELAGFKTVEHRNVVLSASDRLSLGTVKLSVGAMAEQITVTAEGTPVETTNSDHTALLTSKQIEQLQTRSRDFLQLLRTLPGVRYEDGIEAIGEDFGTSVPHISGQRRQWNHVTVDGFLGNTTDQQNRVSTVINLDAISEVKVLLNTYRAEFGRTGGANVQVISKSGGSEYRGSAYYYGRRDTWNATKWENNRSNVPKPEYRFDTYGFNLGGPAVIPGLWKQDGDKKLFFFYSLETPQGQRPPGPIRRYRLPTELERRGDFSQTRDQQGRLIQIKDPLSTATCDILNGGPGCFANNIVPTDRIDRNGQTLLNLFPMPNRLGGTEAGGVNYIRQETADHPRLNNVMRLDWKRSPQTTLYGMLRLFSSKQTGSEITAGPPDWGFYAGTYEFSDHSITGGWTRVFGSSVVNEMSGGLSRKSEGFGVGSDAEWRRLRKSDVGYTLGQFNPQLNPRGLIPRANFGGLPTTGADGVDMNYPDRLGAIGIDWVGSVRDTLTWVRGAHSFKFGGYLEFLENKEARAGNWAGQFTFSRQVNNPLDTNFTYANALLGVFETYTETDRPGSGFHRSVLSEWFAQDTWKPTGRLTVDYGVRFLWYTPWWRPDGFIANFRPELYDPARAPLLYQPVRVGNQNFARNPLTGELVSNVFVGSFVPGTGVIGNGMELANDPGVLRGFRKTWAPEAEPRIGFAYDLFGDGETVLKASAGLYHNARLGGGSLNDMRNPPFINNPTLSFGMMSTMFQPGARLANRPGNVNAIEREAKTPSSYNFSVGIERDIGWGTVVDVAYVGTLGRHLEMSWSINQVPDGARFVDLNPQNADPRNPANALPAEFLRPYRGYQDIIVRGNWGTSNYNALQLQVNRRYIRGLQFGGAYTWSKALGLGDNDPARIALNRPRSFFYSPASHNQAHSLVINYTWDLPKWGSRWSNEFTRALLDGWQISGENAFITGDWAAINISTSPTGFDFTGGEGGSGGGAGGGGSSDGDDLRMVRPVVLRDPRLSRSERNPLTGWFDTTAFARPARGEYGNSARHVIQRPGVENWNLAAFKNFNLGGPRRLQFRIEAYNVLNHTQFSDINRNAQFNAAGEQVNANFGTAIGIGTATRNARIVQISLRLKF